MQEKKTQPDETKIHINHEPHTSANPTTGSALYMLGKIDPSRELFREENGKQEDTIVANDEIQIYLDQGEHFYSEQIFFIIVNGQKKTITKKLLSYDEVVALAFEAAPNFDYTITYRKGPNSNKEGSLVAGQFVKIRNGMIFNVTATNKS
jgi:hypothetical protein